MFPNFPKYQEVKCPHCQYIFAVGGAAQDPSTACPRCAFQVPIPILAPEEPTSLPVGFRVPILNSTAGVGQASKIVSARNVGCGCLLSVAGLAMLLFGVLLMQFDQYAHLLSGGFMLVAGVAVAWSGVYLLTRSTVTTSLTREATIGLTLALLAGACAFIFALAICF
jgi:DNA-directed RNA polymerase subunit RPC12/RpoP